MGREGQYRSKIGTNPVFLGLCGVMKEKDGDPALPAYVTRLVRGALTNE